MGYPEAEYAAQKVINALSGGSSPSGILSPLPNSLQMSITNGKIKATISGNRSVAVSNTNVAVTNVVRLAFNTDRTPTDYNDYTLCIDFDLTNSDDAYNMTQEVEFDSNAIYYKVFALSSTGVVNGTFSSSYPTSGTLYSDDYFEDSRYQLSWYFLRRNTSSISTNHTSGLTDDELKTVYYGINDTFISNAKISNKDGVFQQFDKNHQSSNWFETSLFKKFKPFVIDSGGNAIQQLNPDDFTKTATGEPSIVSDQDSWDKYQGVYVWIPRLYFQCAVFRYGNYFEGGNTNDLCSASLRPAEGFQKSTATIVCSEKEIPMAESTFAESKLIPLRGVGGSQSTPTINLSARLAANSRINTITPGFSDENGKTYAGIWVPCYYASENGKSWPTKPETLTSAESVSDLINKYKLSTNVKLFGGTIWETLNTMLVLFGRSFDVAGTYGVGFKNSEVSGVAPSTQTCTPLKSGFTFSDSGWNKIFNSYVLGSNSYFLVDPYVHTRAFQTDNTGNNKMLLIYESTKMNTDAWNEEYEESTSRPPADSYQVLSMNSTNTNSDHVDHTEYTAYFGNCSWGDVNRANYSYPQSEVVNSLPTMGVTGKFLDSSSGLLNAFKSMDHEQMSYSHRSFRAPFRWTVSSSGDQTMNIYDNFAIRRSPKRHDDLGLSEFMSLYVPNKTNMDTYFSENLVAYATMVLPPNDKYVPVIQEES